jgi:hypothetical protein
MGRLVMNETDIEANRYYWAKGQRWYKQSDAVTVRIVDEKLVPTSARPPSPKIEVGHIEPKP